MLRWIRSAIHLKVFCEECDELVPLLYVELAHWEYELRCQWCRHPVGSLTIIDGRCHITL